MALYNKFNQFVEDLAKKVHNLSADSLVVALSSVAPVATNSVLANLTQIAYTNINAASATARTAVITSCAQSPAGTLKLVLQGQAASPDTILTATPAGSVGFQYVTLYNDTPTSPADPLISWWDYGSSVVLALNDTFTIDWDNTNGVLTIT